MKLGWTITIGVSAVALGSCALPEYTPRPTEADASANQGGIAGKPGSVSGGRGASGGTASKSVGGADGSLRSGGGSAGTVGFSASAGTLAAGGSSVGGISATGATPALGGSGAISGVSGGALSATGGVSVTAGGNGTGGVGAIAASGGSILGNGGAKATGGVATGGVATGGAATGGAATGGAATGGAATGGAAGCTVPMAECDGNLATSCETNTQTDPRYCGSCSNSCTYPVCAAGACPAPTVYGRNAVPSDLTDATVLKNLGLKTLVGYKRTFAGCQLVALGAVTSLSGLVTAGTFRVGLYTNNAGVPGNLVATTGTLTAANGLVEGILSAPLTLAADDYWIMMLVGSVASVKLSVFNVGYSEVVKYQSTIADWPSGGTYADYPASTFVPNMYAKAVTP